MGSNPPNSPFPSNSNPNESYDSNSINDTTSANSHAQLYTPSQAPFLRPAVANPNNHLGFNQQQQRSIPTPVSAQSPAPSNPQPVAYPSKSTLEYQLAHLDKLATSGNNQNQNQNQNQNHQAAPQSIGNGNQNRSLPPNRPPQLDENQRAKQQIYSNFSSALASDHAKVLSPDYKTPFRGVVDALSRLLPYHVYDLPEEELVWAIQQPVVPQEWCSPEREKQAEKDFALHFGEGDELRQQLRQSLKRKRGKQVKVMQDARDSSSSPLKQPNGKGKARQLDQSHLGGEMVKIEEQVDLEEEPNNPQISPDLDLEEEEPTSHPYPLSLTLEFHSRHCKLSGKLSRLQKRSQTSHLESKFQDVSIVQLERLALQTDRETYQQQVNQLQGLKTEAMNLGIRIPGQTHPEPINYPQQQAPSPTQPQAVRPSPRPPWNPAQSPYGRPLMNKPSSYSPNQPRPSNAYTNHQINQTPRPFQNKFYPRPAPFNARPQGSPSATSSSSSPSPLPVSRPYSSPSAASASGSNLNSSSNPSGSSSPASSNSTASKPSIPARPIPLLIPVTHLSRLSDLGIVPIPLPHLLSEFVKLESGQNFNVGANTAPKPPPHNQEDAALLLGITEKEVSSGQGDTNGAGKTRQQLLHVSVVLTKFDPKQLSGLAALMQELQEGGKQIPK